MNYKKIETKENKSFSKDIYELIETLYPICRSITGNGVRATLQILKKYIPIQIHEVPSETPVFDWIVPKEWNINDAYIKNKNGKKIIDFKKSNLHVLNYSIPIKKKIHFNELKKHLHTLPEHPDWIPYLTSYYKENWGFCLSHNDLTKMKEEEYDVLIDSTLEEGSLTYGELFLPGEKNEEILFSCYVCHPSMCNDNLSGIAILTFLAKNLKDMKTKYSYRFLFIPETIGAITWLAQNEDKISNIKGGLIATCLGDSGHSTYKKSKQGNSLIDKVAEQVLIESNEPFEIIDFFPWGSDERQFSSPGFNIPIGSLMRTPYAHENFPQYHTSADNLEFMNFECLRDSFEKYLKIVSILEHGITSNADTQQDTVSVAEKLEITSNADSQQDTVTLAEKLDEKYLNLNPKCEPQLGKRGLYQSIGSIKEQELGKIAILWILSLSDGSNSLLDISVRSGIKFDVIRQSAKTLHEKELLKLLK